MQNLQHFDIDRDVFHVNYRLAGSIPREVVRKVAQDRQSAIEALDREVAALRSDMASEVYGLERYRIEARFELALDGYLDKSPNGPYHLRDGRLSEVVIKSWCHLHEKGAVYVYAVCVMSNHVHVLLGPAANEGVIRTSSVMRSHKSFTARRCNALLGRTGQAFWSDSYFDRTVRRGKFLKVMWYVLNNPVKAGLCPTWAAWPGTWVNPEFVDLFQ